MPIPAIRPDEPATIRRMFERLAPDYDRLNTLLTFGLVHGWRQALVDAAEAGPGHRVLDVCTGTGAVLKKIQARVGRDGLAVGIDFTPAMLERAAGRLVLADALRLPFPEAVFDAAVSGFAVRDVADQRVLLSEMARVTRPGGRVALLEIGRPSNRVMHAGFSLWFRGIVPRVAAAFGQRESHRFLVRSLAYLPSDPEMKSLLEEAGVKDVRRKDLSLGAAVIHAGARTPRGY